MNVTLQPRAKGSGLQNTRALHAKRQAGASALAPKALLQGRMPEGIPPTRQAGAPALSPNPPLQGRTPVPSARRFRGVQDNEVAGTERGGKWGGGLGGSRADTNAPPRGAVPDGSGRAGARAATVVPEGDWGVRNEGVEVEVGALPKRGGVAGGYFARPGLGSSVSCQSSSELASKSASGFKHHAERGVERTGHGRFLDPSEVNAACEAGEAGGAGATGGADTAGGASRAGEVGGVDATGGAGEAAAKGGACAAGRASGASEAGGVGDACGAGETGEAGAAADADWGGGRDGAAEVEPQRSRKEEMLKRDQPPASGWRLQHPSVQRSLRDPGSQTSHAKTKTKKRNPPAPGRTSGGKNKKQTETKKTNQKLHPNSRRTTPGAGEGRQQNLKVSKGKNKTRARKRRPAALPVSAPTSTSATMARRLGA